MAKKTYYWLQLKIDFFKDKAMKKLRKIAGGEVYTIIYLKLQLLSLKDEGMLYFDGIEDDFATELALEIDEDADNVKFTLMYLVKCGLIEQKTTDELLLTAVPPAIGKECDSAVRVRAHRDKKKQEALQCNTEVTNCNTDIEIDIEKDIDINKKNNVQISKADIDTLFEQVWNLYPSKKGKGQVSDVKKKKLYQIGYEELSRVIERYKDYLNQNSDWLKVQNGSTFFNSGYVDYLDANYEPSKSVEKKSNNKFNNCNHRNYDFNALERQLLNLEGDE